MSTCAAIYKSSTAIITIAIITTPLVGSTVKGLSSQAVRRRSAVGRSASVRGFSAPKEFTRININAQMYTKSIENLDWWGVLDFRCVLAIYFFNKNMETRQLNNRTPVPSSNHSLPANNRFFTHHD